jgi:ABC-type nitrate/sulfonate/bicarbonate transport system permease component
MRRNFEMKWELLFPNFEKMLSIFINNPSYFFSNWWATFSVSAMASILALFFGLLASILALRFKIINLFMIPIVAISQSFPLQAIAPLLLIVMGVGFHTKTIIAFIIAFFPIYGACITGLKSTPKPLLCYLSICNSTFNKGIFYVRIPAALPAITSAAKVGFTLAVLGAVVAEFIQPDKGLGYLLLVSQSNYNIEVIYICIFLLIIQGVSIYVSLSTLEKYFIKKRRL